MWQEGFSCEPQACLPFMVLLKPLPQPHQSEKCSPHTSMPSFTTLTFLLPLYLPSPTPAPSCTLSYQAGCILPLDAFSEHTLLQGCWSFNGPEPGGPESRG